MLETLKKANESVENVLKTLDSAALGNVKCRMSELQRKVDKVLTGLSKIQSEVEVWITCLAE